MWTYKIKSNDKAELDDEMQNLVTSEIKTVNVKMIFAFYYDPVTTDSSQVVHADKESYHIISY